MSYMKQKFFEEQERKQAELAEQEPCSLCEGAREIPAFMVPIEHRGEFWDYDGESLIPCPECRRELW